MGEFLAHNPYLIILLIIFIATRIAKTKQDQAKKAQARNGQGTPAPRTQTQRRPAQAAPQRTASTRQGAMRDIEASLLRVMEQADRTHFDASASSAPPQQTPSAQAPAKEDPFAFKSLMHKPQAQRIDYDITARDYDTTPTDGPTGGFGFRPAVDEPVSKEYHLNFQGFQEAHGLNAGARANAAANVAANAPYVLGEERKLSVLGSPDEIRRAIITQEILGKPLSRR